MPTAKEIKLIKTAQRALGMDDAGYRAMLQRVAGVTSCKSLTPTGVGRVLRELERLGFSAAKPGRPNVPEARQPQIKKIGALLAEAGRGWNYVNTMSRKMAGVDKIDWCDSSQLSKIIAALSIDAARHGRGKK